MYFHAKTSEVDEKADLEKAFGCGKSDVADGEFFLEMFLGGMIFPTWQIHNEGDVNVASLTCHGGDHSK